jgi:hypothetical protein
MDIIRDHATAEHRPHRPLIALLLVMDICLVLSVLAQGAEAYTCSINWNVAST